MPRPSKSWFTHSGPHGLSEMVYAYSRFALAGHPLPGIHPHFKAFLRLHGLVLTLL